MTNLMWFRSDLRVYDNPALSQSMKRGDATIAVYCLAVKQWEMHGLSAIKQRLIVDHLILLEEQLSKLNVPLLVIDCGAFESIPTQLAELCDLYDVDSVYYNHEYEVNENNCTEKTVAHLLTHNVASYGYHDQCIVAPGQILNGHHECYKVFSAFAKNWSKNLDTKIRPLCKKPNSQEPINGSDTQSILKVTSDIQCLSQYLTDVEAGDGANNVWLIGEDAAHDRLNEFIENDVIQYHKTRDFPDLNSTSQLSVYLSIGVLSTRQCLQALLINSPSPHYMGMGQVHEAIGALTEGARCWLNELVWREFYRHILVAFPRVCMGKPFIEVTDKLPWDQDKKKFESWCLGQTGIPIVDAAMRQLNSTGWMHNRLRMITAMFLTKNLMIDWRLGEAYFYSKLADADFASNNGGWQWSASTGVDAVPYFRIFNPYRQTERFDPKGDFIRKYVNELATVKGKCIYQPSSLLAMDHNYPVAMINLKESAERTKDLFKNLKNA